ncbi:hypothetical protein [Clostridium botulinum]|uniref:hypothetical protein n=1 Tax=Clostridium botulinum TaxID=1491 RepID=UPI000773B58B|nr:hypothetical protein [Clostridium botulinum]MBN3352144.1 hypothetical protein [Clostridium botulinum]
MNKYQKQLSKRLVLDKMKINNISHPNQILKENFNIDISNNDSTYKPLKEVLKELSDKWNRLIS